MLAQLWPYHILDSLIPSSHSIGVAKSRHTYYFITAGYSKCRLLGVETPGPALWSSVGCAEEFIEECPVADIILAEYCVAQNILCVDVIIWAIFMGIANRRVVGGGGGGGAEHPLNFHFTLVSAELVS